MVIAIIDVRNSEATAIMEKINHDWRESSVSLLQLISIDTLLKNAFEAKKIFPSSLLDFFK